MRWVEDFWKCYTELNSQHEFTKVNSCCANVCGLFLLRLDFKHCASAGSLYFGEEGFPGMRR
jgi:hypothetical protein